MPLWEWKLLLSNNSDWEVLSKSWGTSVFCNPVTLKKGDWTYLFLKQIKRDLLCKRKKLKFQKSFILKIMGKKQRQLYKRFAREPTSVRSKLYFILQKFPLVFLVLFFLPFFVCLFVYIINQVNFLNYVWTFKSMVWIICAVYDLHNYFWVSALRQSQGTEHWLNQTKVQ